MLESGFAAVVRIRNLRLREVAERNVDPDDVLDAMDGLL